LVVMSEMAHAEITTTRVANHWTFSYSVVFAGGANRGGTDLRRQRAQARLCE